MSLTAGAPREENAFQPENLELRKGAETLSRLERLRSGRDFSRIFREGEKVRLDDLTVRWLFNPYSWNRIGTSVGRKFGNAVKRNRVRRIIRELYRRRKGIFPQGIDVVFLPGKKFLDVGHEIQQKQFVEAARRIRNRHNYLLKKGFEQDLWSNSLKKDQEQGRES